MPFQQTNDSIVEIAAIVKVAPAENGSKMLHCTVRGNEHRFLLSPADARHIAALLLKPGEEQPVEAGPDPNG